MSESELCNGSQWYDAFAAAVIFVGMAWAMAWAYVNAEGGGQ